jgi:hypothetical protein
VSPPGLPGGADVAVGQAPCRPQLAARFTGTTSGVALPGGWWMWSAPARWVHALLAVVAVAAAGCGWLQPALSAEALEQRTVALLERLPVEPLGEDFEVTSEQVKLDRPYAMAHAVGREVDLDELAAAVIEVVEGDGLVVQHRRRVDHSLGHEVLAADRRVVLRVQFGPGIDGNLVYPTLERGTYIAIQLANVNSGPAWTEPDR